MLRRNGQLQVIVRRRIGRLVAIVARESVTTTQVILQIQANREDYHFGFAVPDGEIRTLAIETAGSFTGVFFGMYATGNDSACLPPAYFDYFDYAT